jgi:hypothetical protein
MNLGSSIKRCSMSGRLRLSAGGEPRCRVGGDRPMRDQQGAGAGIEEGPRKSRQRLGARPIAGRGVAGGEHRPNGRGPHRARAPRSGLLTARAFASMVARLIYARLIVGFGRVALMVASLLGGAAAFAALAVPMPAPPCRPARDRGARPKTHQSCAGRRIIRAPAPPPSLPATAALSRLITEAVGIVPTVWCRRPRN